MHAYIHLAVLYTLYTINRSRHIQGEGNNRHVMEIFSVMPTRDRMDREMIGVTNIEFATFFNVHLHDLEMKWKMYIFLGNKHPIVVLARHKRY